MRSETLYWRGMSDDQTKIALALAGFDGPRARQIMRETFSDQVIRSNAGRYMITRVPTRKTLGWNLIKL